MGSADCTFKIGVVGDPQVGKTSLILALTSKAFKSDYEQTNQPVSLTRKLVSTQTGVSLRCEIIDTSGRDVYKDLLPLYFKRIDAVVVCYDVTNSASFNNVDKWLFLPCLPERTVRVIVGCKADLEGQQQVTEIMVLEKLDQLDGIQAYEVSAKEGHKVSDVFRHLHSSLQPVGRKKPEEPTQSIVVGDTQKKQKRICCEISS